MAQKDSVYYTPNGSPVRPDLFDVRVRKQFLMRGVVAFDQLKKHLASLPDDSNICEVCSYDELVNRADTGADSDLRGN